MSLINDALKQARQSQQPNQPPSGQTPLRPVEPAPRGVADWILPLVVIALAGAAAFFIGLALARHKPSATAQAAEISAKQPAVAAVANVMNVPATSNAAAAVAPSAAGMKLQGIVYGDKSWAIVDGKTVYVGDSVGNFRVKEISPTSVTLESPDGSQQKLGLVGQ
jgi:hypothetical protein